MIGEIFDGRYKIIRLLGEGGMGAVYEALDQTTSSSVAVKVITANVAKNANLVARFHREAKAAAAIATDEIVQVLETGTDPTSGLPYMVMEYLDGEDLAQLFKRLGPLPVDLALRLGAQACLTLQKAHDARVIHRDIKPANLFLMRKPAASPDQPAERRIKLLDFGVAKIKLESAAGVDTSGLTRTGSMLGSPLYMSPEQARGQKVIDARADIWSLGVVLYQALTGRRPHQDIDGLGELIIAICSELPKPLQDFAPWVPKEVAAIVHGALQFAPDDRFQSASAMFEAINEQLHGSYQLDESMLVPLDAEHKTLQASRLSSVEINASNRTVVRSSSGHVDDVAVTVALEATKPPATADGGADAPAGAGEPPKGFTDAAAILAKQDRTETTKNPRAFPSAAPPSSTTPSAPGGRMIAVAIVAVALAIAALAFAYLELRHRGGQHPQRSDPHGAEGRSR